MATVHNLGQIGMKHGDARMAASDDCPDGQCRSRMRRQAKATEAYEKYIAGSDSVADSQDGLKCEQWSREELENAYHIAKWSDGYFDIDSDGRLIVRPNKGQYAIPLVEVVREMKELGVGLPAVIRFHDILRGQVANLNRTFQKIIQEAKYRGRYFGVYPVKVNQMREVVEEIVSAGADFDYGLEAGSKPELLAALAYNSNPNALTIVNGYKDADTIRLALLGQKLGRKVVVVIEKFSELTTLIELAAEMEVYPIIGIRAKMSIEGTGRWAHSAGEKAKFGLSISQILNAVELLEQHRLKSHLKLFHFHIGSQVTDILTLKDAINEGARIYAKLHKIGVEIEYFDAGGGLGIDYTGGRSTTEESSANYTMREYIEDLVYNLKQICDIEDVPHPHIVTESGRAITAHHSCIVTNVIDKIDTAHTDYRVEKREGEHIIVSNMRALSQEELEPESLQTVTNEAWQIKQECLNAFKLGLLSLDERAKVETLYWKIAQKVYALVNDMKEPPQELQDLERDLSPQFLCNFSVFQSAADCWAIDQILPVMPLERLNERPTHLATLADITCDSDGKIDLFIHRQGIGKSVPLHSIQAGKEYLIGLFLTGAYQDVMGDMHNLFGRPNEIHVYCDPSDAQGFYIEEVIHGHSASSVLSTMQYNPEYMAQEVKRMITKEVGDKRLGAREGVKLAGLYQRALESYTYLSP